MSSSTLTNVTLLAPNGSIAIHDDGHVLCIHGPEWRTALYITTFFATNYLAHAATVKASPGDRTLVGIYHIISALLLPMYGLIRAANAIARRHKWRGSSLENACRAGALCMVVRVPGWMPAENQCFDAFLSNLNEENDKQGQDEEEPNPRNWSLRAPDQAPGRIIDVAVKIYRPDHAEENSCKWAYIDTIGSKAIVDLSKKRVHGSFHLPHGYGFAIIPRDSLFKDTASARGELSSSSTMAKALASLLQTLAAFSALLGRHEDSIDRWGYASYHLTTVQYLIMTIVNFISNMSTADYPCLYMVESPVMDEAKQRGATFDGCVAKLCSLYTERPNRTELKEWADYTRLSVRQIQAAAGTMLSKLFIQFRKQTTITEPDGPMSGAPTSEIIHLTWNANAPEVNGKAPHLCEEMLPATKIGFQSTDGANYIVHHAVCSKQVRTLYVPMCPRFGRGDDRCEADVKPPRTRRSTASGILLEIAFNSVAVGVVILIVASQSRWLSAGSASSVQKVIMLLWICEGVFAVLLPLSLHIRQILGVMAVWTIVSPTWEAEQRDSGFVYLLVPIALYLTTLLVPVLQLCLYVAPIWGFVLVGQMLTERGRCVTLY